VYTILVTGGAGFIGSNFVRYIRNKYPHYTIIVLDALTYAGTMDNLPGNINEVDNFSFWYGNVRNNEFVGTLVSQADIVVHFAAETHVTRSIFDNLLFFETDILGTQAVANAVVSHAKKVKRFLHISTSEVYGTARHEAMNEEHPLLPMSPYASAKCGADRLVYSYWATYDIPAIIVRPFNNYGPHQHLEKAIPRFITSCLLDEPLTIHGDGNAERDWVFVEDHCRALDLIIHCDIDLVRGQVINIGSGTSISIQKIAEMIIRKMNKPGDLLTYISDRPGQVFRHTADIAKAKKLLGWEPSTTFDDGLERTIDWYTKNRAWWEKQTWLRHIPIITKDGRKSMH
jgi:dTDP-glucose 4,6-dehydratase